MDTVISNAYRKVNNMNTIQINKEDAIETLFDEMNNRQTHLKNGEWEVHIFLSKFILMDSDTIEVKPSFHQPGRYYDSELGHYCDISITEFFDWKGELSRQDFDLEALDEEEGREYTIEKINSALKTQIKCDDGAGITCHSYKVEWI
jgi:hypothetical protein